MNKVYELVAALVLRVGGQAAGGLRPLSWTELADVFGVTKDASRHRITRFKQKYNIVDSDVVEGWNREFLKANTPEEEKNELSSLTSLPGDVQVRMTRGGSISHVVINTAGERITINDQDKPVKAGAAVGTPLAPVANKTNDRDIEKRVQTIVCEQLGVGIRDAGLDKRFVEDLGADSLDQVELVMAVEDEFELEISDEDAERIQTVQDVIDYLSERVDVDTTPVVPVKAAPVVAPSEVKNVEQKVMEPLQSLITPAVIVVIRDGQPLTIDKSHKNFEKIKTALEAKQWQDVLDHIDMKTALTRYSNGRVLVEGGVVTLDGEAVPGKITQRLIECLTKENLESLEAIANFLAKCDENPDHRVVTRIYDFIAHNDLRLDKDGFILAYKVVRPDYLDKYTGTMDNSPGKLVQMKRNKVNPRDNETCSFGLHVAARKYIPQYGSPNGGDKVLLCKVHPKDFVSIPTDYNSMKARVCEYLVLKDVTENFTTPVGIEA